MNRTGRTQGEIARVAGIAPATFSRILNGHHPMVSFDTVRRLADATGVRVGWLLNEPFRGIVLSDLEGDFLRSAAAIMVRIAPEKR